MKRPLPTEHAEQSALIQWWASYAATKGIDERLLFSIPNGANKSIAQAMKFKREGLRKGVPDLMLAYPTIMFHGLFIEMKRKGQKGTPEQIDFGLLLRDFGYDSLICLGFEEARQAVMVHCES